MALLLGPRVVYTKKMSAELERLFQEAEIAKQFHEKHFPQPADMARSIDSTETPLRVLKVMGLPSRPGFASIVLTSSNIHIFFDEPRLIGKSIPSHEVFTLKSLTGVTTEQRRELGFRWSWIIEFSRADDFDSFFGPEASVKAFASHAIELMREASEGTGSAIADPIDQLKKLAELLELGAISQSEFDAGKKALLEKL